MASPFWTIARFDFARRLRMVSTWVYAVLYAVVAGMWMAAAGGAISGAGVSFGGDKILINGTNALAIAIGILGFTGITVIGSVAGRAVQQDFEVGIHPFFFSAPITKGAYFFGRLVGAWATLAMIFLGIAVGIVIGSHWPGVDAARIAATPSWQSFARPYLFVLLPNVLWLGGCFFILAALTRQMAPVYIAGVIALVGYLFAVNLLGNMENRTLAALIDPSGATAVDVFTRYWSVAQRNEQQIPLEGVLLWNRFGRITTRHLEHTAAPLRRSVAEQMEQEFPTEFAKTAASTFRSSRYRGWRSGWCGWARPARCFRSPAGRSAG